MNQKSFFQGEVWLVNLNTTIGHEQSGFRPALIISDDLFNNGLSGLIIVMPITSKKMGIHTHIELHSNFLPSVSYIKTEDIRSISVDRAIRRIGSVNRLLLQQVEYHLKNLLCF